jgi:hypothetical protein
MSMPVLRLLLLGFALLYSMVYQAAEAAITCAEKSQLECFHSPECKVTHAGMGGTQDHRYICRENLDRCEVGFIQSLGTKEPCEEKAGCVFEPAHCYCPPNPGLACRCGGGEPASCKVGLMRISPNSSFNPDSSAAGQLKRYVDRS